VEYISVQLLTLLLELAALLDLYIVCFIQQISPASSSGPSPSRSFKAVNGSPSQLGHLRSQLPQRPVSSIVSTQQSSVAAAGGIRDPTRRQSIPSGRPSQTLLPENGPQPPRSSEGPKMV